MIINENTLQKRVIRRTGLVLAVIFVLVALFIIFFVQYRDRQNIIRYTRFSLANISEDIQRALDEPAAALQEIARNPVTQEYARLVHTRLPQDFNEQEQQIQQAFLRSLDHLLEQRGDHYLLAQYITRTGLIVGEVRKVNSATRVFTDVTDVDLLNDPVYTATYTGSNINVPFIGPIQEVDGDSIIDIYVPIGILGENSQVIGTLHLRVAADFVQEIIRESLNDPLVRLPQRQVVLLDSSNTLMAASDNVSSLDDNLLQHLADTSGDLLLDNIGIFNAVSRNLMDDYRGYGMPWQIIIIDNWLGAAFFANRATVGVAAVFLLLWLGSLWFVNQGISPLFQILFDMRYRLRQIASGSASYLSADQTDATHDIGEIYQTVSSIQQQMVEQRTEAEQKSYQYRRDMEVVRRIGREMALRHEIDDLLKRAINLICDEFGYYHAQVFLVDDAGINAVLAYSRGRAGQELLAQQFKLPIGSDSVIGTVTAAGKPVVVNDTLAPTQPHRPNPLLPETRAEIGLPLYISGRVIGVLDIQSKQPDAFQQQTISTLEMVADQIAVAIHYARLTQQAEDRIRQIDVLNRQLTRGAWQQADERMNLQRHYQYDLMAIQETKPNGHAPTAGLESNISIRGEVIGALKAIPSEDQDFTDGDRVIMNAVAERVALAIENARLFQETQLSLAETSQLYELSRYLNEANTLEDIVQSIITSVMPASSGGLVWIFDEYHSSQLPEWMEVHADFDRGGNRDSMMGTRLYMPDHPLLAELSNTRVTLVNNTQADARMTTDLKTFCDQFNARSLVFIPLNMRGLWRGVITLIFEEEHTFKQSEGGIYSALIDQAGVAIENRLLLQQTEEEVARNENLYAASRIINTAQNMQDLVYAAVATTSDSHLNFSLSLLEGELDEMGWPTRARRVAESDGGTVKEVDVVHDIYIPADSPMRQREPQVIVDANPEAPDVSDPIRWIRRQGYQFAAVFPLFSANQPIALFQIMSDAPYTLNDSDYEVYRALTGQMSSQIQIRQLLERTELALDETRRLYIASRALAAATETEEMYARAFEHLTRPFATQSGRRTIQMALLLAKPITIHDAPLLEYAFTWSSDDRPLAFNVGDQVASADYPYGRLTIQSDQTLYIEDVARDETLQQNAPRLLEKLQEQNIASLLIRGLQAGSAWFGVLICQSDRPDAFTEQYQRFFFTIADQIAIALDRQRLFEAARIEAARAQNEAQRALALAEAAQLASRIGDDFNSSLAEVFTRVAQVAGFDRWMLMNINPQYNRLDKVTARIPGFDVAGELSYSLDTDGPDVGLPVVDAVRVDRALTVNDLYSYPGFGSFLEIEQQQAVEFFGKHIAMPVRIGWQSAGVLFVGRAFDAPDDLNEQDEQLVETLSAQVAVAFENRQLFEAVQEEQRKLSSILATLPAGVLVLDPRTLRPTLFNEQAERFLGRAIDPALPFSVEDYHLYRTGTQLIYPKDELPIFAALQGEKRSTDDLVVIMGDREIDLLLDAVPILDEQGQVTAVVAAFQDISNLRGLENTLQENLRETVQLYEAQRQLSETQSIEDVLDTLFNQFVLMQPLDVCFLTQDEGDQLQVKQAWMNPPENPELLRDILSEDDSVAIYSVTDPNMSQTLQGYLSEMGASMVLSVPMRSATRNQMLGWVVLFSMMTRDEAAMQSPMLSQLTDMASTVMDNRYLIQQQETTLREIANLYNANTAISRAREIEQLANALTDALAIMEADYFTAYLDESAGILMENNQMLHYSAPGHPVVDFGEIMLGYDLPPMGLFIDDLQALNYPDTVEKQLIDTGVRGLGIVHLRPQDLPAGFLLVGYTQPHNFSDGESRYMNTLSDSASVILNNIRLFEETQRSLEETSTLYQASRALSDATTPAEIVDVVVNYLLPMHVDQVFIALLNTRSWEQPHASVTVVAGWSAENDLDLQDVTLSVDQFPAWKQLATPTVLTIDDVHEDERLSDMERISIESLEARSLVVMPLRVPNRAIGAIWLGSREPHVHRQQENRTYQAFAEQASLSLEASYLLAQTERRARQLQTSSEVGRSIGTILDLGELLPSLVDIIKDAFGYDHVQVFMMDERDEYAELRASTGDIGQTLLSIKHKLRKGSDSVIGQVTATREAVIALDTADASVVHQPNPYLPLTRSEMALPLIVKGVVVGALDVQSNQSNAFNEEDIIALRTLAGQIAIAIDNANLYEAAQEQAGNMRFLFDVTNVAAAADTLDDALAQVAQDIHSQLNAAAVVIYLPRTYIDAQGNEFVMIEPAALAGVDQPLSELEKIAADDPDRLIAVNSSKHRPTVINDLRSVEGYIPVAPAARSAAILPLVSGNKVIGLILLEDQRPGAYPEERLRILRALAGSLSAVIQSTLLLEQLQETNQQLLELDRLKSDFLANMSHELRTPLNSIIGFSRVMLKGIDGPLTEMQEQDLTTIFNSGQHLLMLINDVLDQAKIAAGKLDIKVDYFEIKPMVEAVKSIGVGLVKDKNISMVTEIAPNLPKVYGDEFRTRQVLLNLVSNAAKFTNEGSITLRAYRVTDDETRRDMIQIEVQDTGIGIAQKDIPLLFEAFRQVDSSLTRTQGGTGLGLPIAKSLVEMQGGQMTVRSEVNRGSNFSFTIPLEPVEQAEPEPAQDAPEERDEKRQTQEIDINTNPVNALPPELDMPNLTEKPKTRPTRQTTVEIQAITPPPVMPTKREVLLIEDDKNMVDQFRRILQREGFEVQTADHPAYALSMAGTLRPTLIIMDVNFANGQGWDILQELKDRDDTFDIPLIIVTLNSDSARAYQLGARHFIQRPFIPDDLVEAVLDAERESNTERILIIDDQPESIRLLTQLLNDNGTYRVFSAASGLEGISMVARRHPDLIILDLRMPEMDGFAVLEELRANPETANIPVLIVTGELNLEADEEARLANIRVLHKSDISQEEYDQFIADVRKHLDIHEGNS